MKSKVLLITFNRPQYVRLMLKALKEADVKDLLIFRDGPRTNIASDLEQCEEIEKLVRAIDWECNVKINCMQNNLGCGYGPYTAISWAFQFTDKLIILEDDCIPTPEFFSFCDSMLEKYSEDDRVRIISGRSQYSEHEIFEQYDYIFTQYAPTWGWATWKRVWNGFDMQERCLQNFFKNGGFKKQFANKRENEYWNYRYYYRLNPMSDSLHIWDYQFGAYSRMNGAVGIVPKANMIKYIGTEGTHPTTVGGEIALLPTASIMSFSKIPNEILLNTKYEGDYFDRFHGLTLKFKLRCYINLFKSFFQTPSF